MRAAFWVGGCALGQFTSLGTFQPTTYWRTVSVPGAVVEPPGGCGYVVTAPVANSGLRAEIILTLSL